MTAGHRLGVTNLPDAIDAIGDILAPSLDVVFCGINPAGNMANGGHCFSSASNRFWSAIHLAGFTDRQLAPEDERELLKFGYGLTTAVGRPTRRAHEVGATEIRAAWPTLSAKILRYRPRVIAFLGKRAISEIMDKRHIDWGEQSTQLAEARVWVLPNPSGRNRKFSLTDMVELYRDLRQQFPPLGSSNATAP